MNLLLTGATGFLGSHLARTLLAQGHRVIVLKRRTSDLRRLAGAQLDLVFYDVEGLDWARPFTEHGQVEAVIHTATCYGRQGESAAALVETNLLLPLRLLEAAAFFNTTTFFNTDTILYPYLNAYALSKRHFVEWSRQFAEAGRIQFVNILLEHLYGPGDDESKFTTQVIKSCLANVPELPLTPGGQRRDFIYIEDAVAAYGLLLRRIGELGPGFQEFDLGSGRAVTIQEFVETVHRLTQSQTRLVFGALPYREHEMMESSADVGRLRAMGWRCQTDLVEGINQIIRMQQRNIIAK